MNKSYITPFLVFIILLIYAIFFMPHRHMRCLELTRVVEIIELDGRDAVIRLGNGSIQRVNQAQLKVGSPFCARQSYE